MGVPKAKKASNSRRDNTPKRIQSGSARARQYEQKFPNKHRERAKRLRDLKKNQGYADAIEKAFNPIVIESDAVLLIGDLHLPFMDWPLFYEAIDIAKDEGIKTCVVGGDEFDCDSFSYYMDLTPKKMSMSKIFDKECEEVAKVNKILYREFDNISCLKGNHELRWLRINEGHVDIHQMYKLAMPSNLSEDQFFEKFHVTQDDFLYVIQNGEKWRINHPKNFRKLNLSVVRDLASIYLCHQIGFHGHQWAQGKAVNNKYTIADGGGLFDKDALAYLRATTCHALTHSGFYTLIDGILEAYPGR